MKNTRVAIGFALLCRCGAMVGENENPETLYNKGYRDYLLSVNESTPYKEKFDASKRALDELLTSYNLLAASQTAYLIAIVAFSRADSDVALKYAQIAVRAVPPLPREQKDAAQMIVSYINSPRDELSIRFDQIIVGGQGTNAFKFPLPAANPSPTPSN